MNCTKERKISVLAKCVTWRQQKKSKCLEKGTPCMYGTFGLGKVKIHNFNRCFWRKLEETIYQRERHAQNVRLNCCLNSATPVNSFLLVANITWLWVSDCCTRYLHCDQPFIRSGTGDLLKIWLSFRDILFSLIVKYWNTPSNASVSISHSSFSMNWL
jgi:hypothetical protein